MHPKYLDPSGHLALLPTLDSQSFCFKKRARLCLFLLWERGQKFSFFLPFLCLQIFHLLLAGRSPVLNCPHKQPGLLVAISLWGSRTEAIPPVKCLCQANWAFISATHILAIHCWETTDRAAELLGEAGRGGSVLFSYPTSAWLLQHYLKSAKIWQIDFWFRISGSVQNTVMLASGIFRWGFTHTRKKYPASHILWSPQWTSYRTRRQASTPGLWIRGAPVAGNEEGVKWWGWEEIHFILHDKACASCATPACL